jgi:hypothetical protein
MEAKAVKASVAETYPMVTTYLTYGGVGLGRLVNGTVMRDGGDGWYYPVTDGALRRIVGDGGAGYMARVKELCGA